MRHAGLAFLPAFVVTVLLASCGDAPDTSVGGAPTSRPAAGKVVEMTAVEELTEACANRLIEFSNDIRKRDFDAARVYLSEDFQGIGFQGHATPAPTALPLGTTETIVTVAPDAPHLDRTGFLTSIEELIGGLAAVEHVFLKTRGAEFDADGRRGDVRQTFHVIGRREGGAPFSFYAWSSGEVRLTDGGWQLARYRLERFRVIERRAPLFTDVAGPAGLARLEPRLGTAGNDRFYWRGAACGDVDGDGLFDVFTSAHDRNFLYRSKGDGTFEDVAARVGLGAPIGSTSPLFFDYDGDGDADLFCAHVGWEEDGVPRGTSLRLFRNDGGTFVDVSAETGLAELRLPAFGTIAADFDGDGWLDLYVCSYNRLDASYPDSWYRATNGTPNLLLRNEGGKRFTDVAGAAGVAGGAWSYAAAAADFDEDGDQDLYVANDYGDNNLFLNRGDGTFVDVAAERGVLDTGNGMAAAWGDLDGDGDLDLYVSNMSSSAGNRILARFAKKEGSDVEGKLYKLAAGNSIFTQNDDGTFQRAPESAGGIGASWAWGASLLDIDLDGHGDIYCANGFISGDSLKDT